MSVLSIQGHESKTVSHCYNHPPQYNICKPSEDILTSVIEDARTRRYIRIRLDDIGAEMLNKIQKMGKKQLPDSPDFIFVGDFYQDMGRLATEMGQLLTELGNITNERAEKHTDLYIVMCRLSEDEFNQIYDSLKRDLNQQIQHGLAQDDANGGYCYDRPFSRDRFLAPSTEVDRISKEPDQSLPSYDTANPSKMKDDTAAATKPRGRFWVKLMKIVTEKIITE